MSVDEAVRIIEDRREALLEAVADAAEQFLRNSDWATCIDDVLARLGAAADVSRVHLFENHPGADGELYAVQRNEWLADGVAAGITDLEPKGRPYDARGLGRWRDELALGNLIGGPVVDLSGPERRLLERYDIQSVLLVPIFAGDDWWGSLGFDDIRRAREWNNSERELLRAAASMLGAAIQRRRSVELAELNQERLALALDGTDQGLWDWDIPGDTIYYDERWTSMLGYHPGEVMPTFEGWEALLHPDDMESVVKALSAHLAGDTPVYYAECRLRARNGSWRWILDRGRVVARDEAGNPVRMIGTHTDVTDRRAADEQLRLLSKAVEQSPVSIVITDAEGTIAYVNENFTVASGYSREEAIGQNPRILNSGMQSAEFYEDLWATVTAGGEWTGEFVNRRKDGSLFRESAVIAPVVDDYGAITHYIGVKQDVTELKSLEDQLRVAQKLEAVGRLAGGVAHDFNNMLTAITGFAGLLEDEISDDEPARTYVGEIRGAALRSADLTRQLLAFSRRQLIQPVKLDLNEAVRGVEKLLVHAIGEHVRLELRLEERLHTVYADGGQIAQTLLNLAVNARDAMPEGGTLRIRTRNVALRHTATGTLAYRVPPGDYVELSVEDTGIGISAELLPHIFDPFFTTKEVGKGTGLGLATVYGIVKQNGGFIDVQSQAGNGTRVGILLPRLDDLPENAVAADRTTDEASAATILLVEDEASIRSLTGRILRRAGYDVTSVDNAGAALARTGDRAPDLLIADVGLPNSDSRELVRQLRRRWPTLKVLLLSNYADADPDCAVLEKPFHPSMLLERVAEVMDG
ncbi:MAG: PAS domain-containing protein [Gemmatimonadota bacterium]|jgi:two-component system, cell cycle sensor histidine kinase and response regulator CckA